VNVIAPEPMKKFQPNVTQVFRVVGSRTD